MYYSIDVLMLQGRNDKVITPFLQQTITKREKVWERNY